MPHLLDIYTTPLQGHTLIEASAGTGKTWTISGLYTRLLLDETLNLKVSEILVVTFTRAATAELRERIRKRLSDVLDSFEMKEGVDEFCARMLEHFTGDREHAIRKLSRAVASFDEAAIFTIDGFCQRVLGEAAFESRSDFRFELLTDESDVLQEVAEDFWRLHIHEAKGAWMEYLLAVKASPEQWLNPLKPFIAKVKQCWPLPKQPDVTNQEQVFEATIETLQTLWESEAETLKQQLIESKINKTTLKAILGRWQKFDTWMQLEEFASALLKAADAGKPDDFVFFTSTKVATSMNKGAEPFHHAIFECIETLLAVAIELVAAYQLRLRHVRAALMEWIQQESAKRKATRQQMTFDDLLMQVWKALQVEHASEAIAASAYPAHSADSVLAGLKDFICKRYRAALIDEFQDTDPIQASIFQTVYADSGLPLYYVGDPKQSIYAFRGADILAYLDAKKLVSTEAVKTLGTNQRSAPRLIEAVNTLFSHSSCPFIDPGIAFYPVQPSERVRDQLIIHDTSDDVKFPELLDDGVPFRFLLLPDLPADAKEKSWKKDAAIEQATVGVANEIARLLLLSSQGKALLEGRVLHGGDIAVLVQDSWKGKKIQDALARRGVASVRRTQESVYESLEARELLSVLTAIVFHKRWDFIRTALSTDLMGYSMQSIVNLANMPQEWEKVLDHFTAWHALWNQHGFMRVFRDWLSAESDVLALDIALEVDKTDNSDREAEPQRLSVPERLLQFSDGERRLTNLLHLSELIQAESQRALGMESLLGWLARKIADPSTQSESDATLMRLESDAKRVKIVTIHASKGLEYPIVFCPYLFDSRLRDSDEAILVHYDQQTWLDVGSERMLQHRRESAQKSLEENLRLLYVALTRAKYRCYCVWGNINVLEESKETQGNTGNTASMGDALKTGFHTAALSWLLHPCPDQAMTNDPIRSMRQWCVRYKDRQIIEDEIQALAGETIDAETKIKTKAIGVYPLRELWCQAPAPSETMPQLAPAVFKRSALKWGWKVASFSGLTRQAKTMYVAKASSLVAVNEAPDRDEDVPLPVEGAAFSAENIEDFEPFVNGVDEKAEDDIQSEPQSNSPSIFNYPLREIKASVAGTCVHNILECWNWSGDRALDDSADLAAIIERESKKSGLKEHWHPVLAELVENTVYCELMPDQSESIQLMTVPKKQRLAEMEFTFPVSALSVDAIIEVLSHSDYGVSPHYVEAARLLDFETLQGFLRGYIDLIIQANDRFYVLDYKTNHLGNQLEDYHAEALEEAVAHHHYYLQYLLYTVAVHRYLGERLPDYSYESHFGGVLYLFLRGLGDRSGQYGVHRDYPSPELIQALSDALSGGATNA
ncbi:MAG: UvrD-helicase domain-containing protein [Pseudomonadota bacterium]